MTNLLKIEKISGNEKNDPLWKHAMLFPAINPIALQLGPLTVRWYGLAYVVGLLGWWRYSLWLTKKFSKVSHDLINDYLGWAVIGVVLGGRLGFVLFYNPSKYMADPLKIFQVWEGGMSFHGGLLGIILATLIYTYRRGINCLNFSDLAVCGVPIGLFFGRLANFINGELFGRITEVSWGIQFPYGGPYLRHPSQLYEAFSEGFLLFILLFYGALFTRWPHRQGLLTGIFLIGYATSRMTCEVFREPDFFLGYFAGGFTMGQILSLPVLGFGIFLSVRALVRKENA